MSDTAFINVPGIVCKTAIHVDSMHETSLITEEPQSEIKLYTYDLLSSNKELKSVFPTSLKTAQEQFNKKTEEKSQKNPTDFVSLERISVDKIENTQLETGKLGKFIMNAAEKFFNLVGGIPGHGSVDRRLLRGCPQTD